MVSRPGADVQTASLQHVLDQLVHSVIRPFAGVLLERSHHGLDAQLLSLLAASLQYRVQSAQERVERRVERQHEDGGPHVDLSRDGRASRRQQPHDAHREPAAEVGEDDEGETAANGHVQLTMLGTARHGRVVDRSIDGHLAGSNHQKEDRVHNDENSKGVTPAGK